MKRLLPLALLTALALSACGGGGSSSGNTNVLPASPNVQSSTFALQTALKNFYAGSHSFNLSGVNNSGDTISASLSFVPGPTQTLNGITANVTQQNLILKQNGNIIVQGTTLDFFKQPNGDVIGFDSTDLYGTVTSGGTLPDNAQIGQTGAYYTANLYSDSGRTNLIATETASYEVDQDTSYPSTTALVCFNYTTNPSKFGETDCFHVDTPGNVTAPQVRISLNGQSITLK